MCQPSELNHNSSAHVEGLPFVVAGCAGAGASDAPRILVGVTGTAMSEQQNVFPCTKDAWTLIPTPRGLSKDARLCEKQEEWLRTKHPTLKRHPAVIRAKGNGTVIVDLNGIHWVPNVSDGTPLKLQVALLDGQGVVAFQEFERPWGWEKPG
jgi:hypothetical protein